MAKKAAKKDVKKAAKKPAAKKAAKKKVVKKVAKKKSARKPSAAFMKPLTPSAMLAEVVGSKPLPRTEVVKKIWVYIKANKLQDKVTGTPGGDPGVLLFYKRLQFTHAMDLCSWENRGRLSRRFRTFG